LIPSSYTQVNLTLSDESRYIGCRKEYQGNGQVLDESYVETVLSLKLDIGAFEEVECGLIQSALYL
jgi:hypothetical protein